MLGIPTLITLIVITVAIPLGVLGIGLAVLGVFVPFLRQLANVHRYFATQVLRTSVLSPYHERESRGVNVVVKDWARDPARWRDLGWSYASVTVGWLLSWVPVVLLLGVVWFLIFPFIYAVTPAGVFDMDWRLVQVHDVASSFAMWVPAALCVLAWWFVTPPVSRLRARMDLALLSPTRAELEKRLAEVSASRTETIDHSAAELRRIERDLHDGAQARLVEDVRGTGLMLGVELPTGALAEEALRQGELKYRTLTDAIWQVGWAVSPDDAYQMLRGIRTLPTRLARHGENAVARF